MIRQQDKLTDASPWQQTTAGQENAISIYKSRLEQTFVSLQDVLVKLMLEFSTSGNGKAIAQQQILANTRPLEARIESLERDVTSSKFMSQLLQRMLTDINTSLRRVSERQHAFAQEDMKQELADRDCRIKELERRLNLLEARASVYE